MSCRERHRFDFEPDGTSAHLEALRTELIEHIGECYECRRRALVADPTLVFATMGSPAAGAEEVRAMQLRVAGARRLLAGEERVHPWRRWRERAVAAAAVLVALTSLTILGITGHAAVEEVGGAAVVAVPVDEVSLASDRMRSLVRAHVASLPLADGSHEVRLQVEDEEFDLVVLSDLRLEVAGP